MSGTGMAVWLTGPTMAKLTAQARLIMAERHTVMSYDEIISYLIDQDSCGKMQEWTKKR
jgi:hypothetical protein